VGLEEDIVQSCVKHMNDCAKRIEQLKNLRVNEDYEPHLKPLINKEIERCVDEYLNSLTFLTQRIEEYDDKTISSLVQYEDALNQEELTYKLLVKLLQINGLIDHKGNLSEKGAELLKKELKEDQEIRPESKDILDKKDTSLLSDFSASQEGYEKETLFGKPEKIAKRRGEKISLEDELRYLIKKREKPEPEDCTVKVICPSCLSKTKIGDHCSVCGYDFKFKERVDEKIPDPIENFIQESKQTSDIDQEEKELEKSFSENAGSKDLMDEAFTKEKKEIGVFVNLVSILSIIIGVIILSGCIFTAFTSMRSLEEGTASLMVLLYLLVDTLPGIPFSSNFIITMNFWIRLFIIALSGFLLLAVGFGLRRDNVSLRYLSISIFMLSSLVDIYSIIIIDLSETIVPFLGLIINIVLIYIVFTRIILTS
jgi:hypothetical protein